MKKILLYFLLVLFLLALGTLTYGFWNAKNIRESAKELDQIRTSHGLSPKIEEIESEFSDSNQKDLVEMREDLFRFQESLDEIREEAERARGQTDTVTFPKIAFPAKEMTISYYEKVASQAGNLRGLMEYIGQITEVASVFSQMNEQTNLSEIQELIKSAQEKSNATDTADLPEDLKTDARNLNDSMNNFLSKMEKTAALKTTSGEELNEAYQDFSAKESKFFESSEAYVMRMEDLNDLEKRIDSEITRLRMVKFSLH